jgi:hypothetical protein
MDYAHQPSSSDFIGRHLKSVQQHAFQGRLACNCFIARCTANDDPLKLNRIRVNLQFQNDVGKAEMQTGWLKQITLFAGPTDSHRGIEAWGLDYPLPEVHQDVFVFFNGGDIHDGYWFGVPRYSEGDRSVPRIEKDQKKQFSFRMKLPNGFEFAIETGGSTLLLAMGHLRVKAAGNLFVSSCGKLKQIATRILIGGQSVIKQIAPVLVRQQYRKASEDPELRADVIDAYTLFPGKEDPGIRKPTGLS